MEEKIEKKLLKILAHCDFIYQAGIFGKRYDLRKEAVTKDFTEAMYAVQQDTVEKIRDMVANKKDAYMFPATEERFFKDLDKLIK